MIVSILCIPGAAPCFIEHFTQLMMIIRGAICGYWAPPGQPVFLFQGDWRTSHQQCLVPYYKTVTRIQYFFFVLIYRKAAGCSEQHQCVYLYTKNTMSLGKTTQFVVCPKTSAVSYNQTYLLLLALCWLHGFCVHWFYGSDNITAVM